MKRVFIVHGWSGRPNEGWMGWLNKELSAKGIKVYAERMPDPDFPKISLWVSHLKMLVGEADEETYFIGHSIGCQTILRYIESLPERTKIGGAIFVAGWFNLKNLETDEERKVSSPWLRVPINFDKIKSKMNKSAAILSSDDPWVPVSDSKIFESKLGSKIIIEDKKGHYIEKETKTIPAALKEILSMLNL